MEKASIHQKTGLYWLWISGVVIILDQVSKYLITHYFAFEESVNLLPILDFTLEHNTGAAFSFLHQAGAIATGLFIATAIIISLVLCLWLHKLPMKNYWLGISLALILGGAVGNLIDRMLFGFVIDFIHFHLGRWSFAIFNLADTAITIGACMLITDVFRRKSDENTLSES